MNTKFINGYKIMFNDFWQLYEVSHSEIGVCGYFEIYDDAIQHAKNG